MACENGELKVGELAPELGMKEADYRNSSEDFYRKIKGTWRKEEFEEVFENLLDEIITSKNK